MKKNKRTQPDRPPTDQISFESAQHKSSAVIATDRTWFASLGLGSGWAGRCERRPESRRRDREHSRIVGSAKREDWGDKEQQVTRARTRQQKTRQQNKPRTRTQSEQRCNDAEKSKDVVSSYKLDLLLSLGLGDGWAGRCGYRPENRRRDREHSRFVGSEKGGFWGVVSSSYKLTLLASLGPRVKGKPVNLLCKANTDRRVGGGTSSTPCAQTVKREDVGGSSS